MSRPVERKSPARIVFLTREPVLHQQGGSTTYILGLLELLRVRGADVTLLATTAFGRSPRLFFRISVPPPAGVQLHLPGYLKLGRYYVLPFRLKAWARLLARSTVRRDWLRPVRRLLERVYGESLFTGAWDLTTPTPAECEVAAEAIEAAGATTVLANYCLWGPLLADGRLGRRRTAILMHDLLSARTQQFLQSGMPLDSPPIREEDELRWLSSAHTVLASQEREAEAIRPRISAEVIVTPVILHPKALDEEQVEAGRCLFVGANIPPNRTGLEFLLESVWPRVRAAVPGATLAVAGTVGQVLGEGLTSLGVEKLGVVPSLEAEYARAAVCLVPLLIGSGIKIKLLEALGYGKAIVSTSIGIQGLETWAHQAMEVADDGDAFCAAIVALLTDERRRRQRQLDATRLAGEHFGVDRPLTPEFMQALL